MNNPLNRFSEVSAPVSRIPDSSKTHFHIQWIDPNRLDWECFYTLPDAFCRAQELAAPNEGFTIEEVSTNCPMVGFCLGRLIPSFAGKKYPLIQLL
jgi:hypothetical protein